MRNPFFFEPLFRAFYSGLFYRQALKKWEWKALGYAVLLSMIIPIFSAVKLLSFTSSLAGILHADMPHLSKYAAEVTVKEGRLFVEPQKGISIVKDGVYTIPGADGKPLAILDTTRYTVPDDLGGAKYYLAAREGAFMNSGALHLISFLPEFSVKTSEMSTPVSTSAILGYTLKMYPAWARDRITLFMIYAFLFVIPAFGVSRYFGLRFPFYKLVTLSILTLTPAVLADIFCITVLNKHVVDLIYMSLITIMYQVFACYRIVKLEEAEIEQEEKGKTKE